MLCRVLTHDAHFTGTLSDLIFFASSRNLAKPMSVRGCFSSPRIDSNGHVHTSAPASAHFTIWSGLRMEAARISVSKPWMSIDLCNLFNQFHSVPTAIVDPTDKWRNIGCCQLLPPEWPDRQKTPMCNWYLISII